MVDTNSCARVLARGRGPWRFGCSSEINRFKTIFYKSHFSVQIIIL